MKNLGENEAWAYPETPQIFRVPPIISWTGKATDFKCSQYIQRVHPNKSPWKILEKRERGHIQGLPKFFGYPILSQKWGKLRISNFACTFMGSIGTKAHKKFGKSSGGRSQGLPKISRAPIHTAHRAVIFAIAQLSCLHLANVWIHTLDKQCSALLLHCRNRSQWNHAVLWTFDSLSHSQGDFRQHAAMAAAMNMMLMAGSAYRNKRWMNGQYK